MKKIIRAVLAAVASVALVLTVSACGPTTETQQRKEQAKQSAAKDTLEKKNLRKKLGMEEDPNRIGYVYLMSFGKPIGYYTVKGKISSNGSQVDPEDLIDCPYTTSAENCQVIDGPQDDGTYGDGDPGIFFFTTEGVMVDTNLDYFYATQPVPSAIEVPKLG